MSVKKIPIQIVHKYYWWIQLEKNKVTEHYQIW